MRATDELLGRVDRYITDQFLAWPPRLTSRAGIGLAVLCLQRVQGLWRQFSPADEDRILQAAQVAHAYAVDRVRDCPVKESSDLLRAVKEAASARAPNAQARAAALAAAYALRAAQNEWRGELAVGPYVAQAIAQAVRAGGRPVWDAVLADLGRLHAVAELQALDHEPARECGSTVGR